MKRILLTAVFTMAAFTFAASAGGDDFGGVKPLRSNSVFDESPPPPVVTYKGDEPGKNPLMPRGFEGAPPQIPHSIENLNVDAASNDCLMCHDPAYASEKTVTVPPTHMENGVVSNARFNCTQCHVPQADVKPLVKNENDKFIKAKTALKKK